MRAVNLSVCKRAHFIGIGGVSMSGLAEILLLNGCGVSGSDEIESKTLEHLRSLGVRVYTGHAAGHITDDIELVIYTAAVTGDNPEYRAALDMGIPVIDRAELLGCILDGYAYSVCVAGSHGKTGTTAMLAETCLAAGLDPGVSIGGYMGEGYNFRVGHSQYFIAEACEYFDSFLKWNPYIGIILNIDNDHMDYFGTMERLNESFAAFARNVRPEGALVIHGGVAGIEQITADLTCRVLTYGVDGADITAANIAYDAEGRAAFDIVENGRFTARAALRKPGAHYMSNALAVYAACRALGVPPAAIAEGLSASRGVKRRFERKGVFNGAAVVDDYAHHPTEIKATLAAARAGHGGRIICAFQPHTYTRTEFLLDDFAASFTDADVIILLPIFASREAFTLPPEARKVSSRDLAAKITANGQNAASFDSFAEAEAYLRGALSPGDLLLTMGAGDVYLIGEALTGV